MLLITVRVSRLTPSRKCFIPLFTFLYSDTCKKRHEYGVDRKQGRFFLLRKALAMTPNCKGSVKRYLIFLENERRSALADTRDRSCKIWTFLIGQVPAYCFSKSAAPSGSSNYALQRMPERRGLRRQPALAEVSGESFGDVLFHSRAKHSNLQVTLIRKGTDSSNISSAPEYHCGRWRSRPVGVLRRSRIRGPRPAPWASSTCARAAGAWRR